MPVVSSTPATQTLTVALIGNPNTGKSTLFNALTGGRARVGNFPGVTVEKKIGKFEKDGQEVTVIDLPGTYSLSARSADEMVSVDVLLGRRSDIARPDAIVCIVDSSNLERNLYLFSQLRDLGLPVLLVLNMSDVAERNGIKINVERLQARLNVVAIQTSASQRKGLNELRDAIVSIASREVSSAPKLFPEVFYEEEQALKTWVLSHGGTELPDFLLQRLLLDVHGETEHQATVQTKGNLSAVLVEARQRLNEQGCRIPLIETKSRYAWIRQQLHGVVERSAQPVGRTTSDRIDKVLTHKVTGLLFFVFLMLLVFQSIYTWAGPVMTMVEGGQEWMSETVKSVVPPGILRSLLVDALIAGVGSVVVFLPQIVILFLFIAVLEDCGYMARAAFLMDKLMVKIGLSGRSFLPLMSSFACAIPGVMATRTIENRRDRMVTMLVAPLMSCSARLPVYVLMIAAFVPSMTIAKIFNLQGLVLFGMHALGALIAIPIAWLLKKTVFPGETPPFVMELPQYKWPSPRIVFGRVWDSAKAFLFRAGTLIFCVTVLVWAAGYFPESHQRADEIERIVEANDEKLEDLQTQLTKLQEDTEATADAQPLPQLVVLEQEIESLTGEQDELGEELNKLNGEMIRNSFLGRAGRAIEPLVKPLGWDWRIGVGAIASFPAREVIIATMGTIFSLGGDVDEESEGLIQTLQSATWPDGAPLFTIPVAFSVMVFFALCAQCGATLMVMRRETNSWRWPAFSFVYMTALAYVGAFLVYQIGTWLMG